MHTYEVELGKSWYGSKPLLMQIFEPVALRVGLVPLSRKRAARGTATGGTSDHWIGALRAYATDYYFPAGWSDTTKLQAVQALAAMLPDLDGSPRPRAWRPDAYQSFYATTTEGKAFRLQLLYGSLIDHDDHAHLGIRRL